MSRIPHITLGAAAVAVLVAAGFAGGFRDTVLAARSTPGSLPGVQLGTSHSLMQHAFLAYYDGHKDSYVNTDVSNKSQATSLGVNYAPLLAHTLSSASPMYFVKGRAAAGQIAVFGSEPGGSDYSPLWREIWVTWKAGAKPALLIRDDQIKSLAKAGKLTETMSSIVLNAPVTSVGH